MRRRLSWEYTKRILDVIQTIAIVIGVLGIVIAAYQFYYSGLKESASIGMTFDDRLSQGTNLAIGNRIGDGTGTTTLLNTDHPQGPFTADQLAQYLGEYDTLWYLYQEGLINDQMVYNLFCADLESAYSNNSVQTFVVSEQTGGPMDKLNYIGFDEVAQLCVQWDSTGRGWKLGL